MLLLATFDNRESAGALSTIANGRILSFRCTALQSLASLSERWALPVLVGKLDDKSVCMQIVVTDPAREYDVYVSDEAVRLLENVTGLKFEKPSDGLYVNHRATRPWKKWWEENKQHHAPAD